LSSVLSEAFYADVRGGRRFCVVHRPETAARPRGALIHIHAFAEEMNKSRRTVASAARSLAARGWAVLLIDLAGCGDSSGDFGEANWRDWVDDALFAYRWASEHFGGSCWLWGLRAGCLIAAEAGARQDGRPRLLLWQPVLSGRAHLTQFLRLKLANQVLGGQTKGRSGTNALRARLANGEALEIAGYVLSPLLADGLERAELSLAGQHAHVLCVEVSSESNLELAPATAARLAEASSRGVPVHTAAVRGPLFWHTVEIAECPALIDTTVEALDRVDAAGI
jgi:exosortase A-associated hydrolase 2